MSEDSEEMLPEGTYTRHNRYYTIMKARVKGKTSHPINNGIAMQAHHLISCEGAKMSGKGNLMKKAGYDINNWPNMVFLPSTLQGACHLGVQLHRGNHTAPVRPTAQNDGDSDSVHPLSYHKMVIKLLRDLTKDLKEACENKKEQEEVILKLNKVSKKVLKRIQSKPRLARLTKIYNQFQPDNPSGCSNVDNIGKVSTINPSHCKIQRNHLNNKNEGQRSEEITYNGSKPFKLTVGN